MRIRSLAPMSVLAAAVVVAGAAVLVERTQREPTKTITATFAETPGLYRGNHVEVIGIPVGRITRVQPEPGGVEVTMQVRASLKVPAQAEAVLMAPQAVNDRFIQLAPAYDRGPTMPAGAHIPESRTTAPLSVDQILASLNSLFSALGPTAVADKGVLGTLIAQLNAQLGGQGSNLHDTIGAASIAISDLASDGPGLTTTLTNLSTLVGSLAADAGNYQSFTTNLATVAADLNGDRGDLASALSTLQHALSDVTTFVKANSSRFGASLDNLETAASALAGQQSQLGRTLQISPLALQNLALTVHQTPSGPAIKGRFDPVSNTPAFVDLMCGSVLLRAFDLGANQAKAPVIDPICAFGAAVGQLRLPPGSPTGPVLTVPALLAAEARG